MIDLSRLNPPQREAVEHTEGPLLDPGRRGLRARRAC